jgi:hypothetical protein
MLTAIRKKYDYAYMDYIIKVLYRCKDYGFRVYMDPHQDVVSLHRPTSLFGTDICSGRVSQADQALPFGLFTLVVSTLKTSPLRLPLTCNASIQVQRTQNRRHSPL